MPSAEIVAKAYLYLTVTTLVAAGEGRIDPALAEEKIKLTRLSPEQVAIARRAAKLAQQDPFAGRKGHDVSDYLAKAKQLN